MVGVAGKSQACNTCRQRRVKCDLARPSCRKCIISNRPCAGYGHDLIFVNRTLADPLSNAPSVLAQRKARPEAHQNLPVIPNISLLEAELRDKFTTSPCDHHAFRRYAVEFLKATYLPKRANPGSSVHPVFKGSFSWVYRLGDLRASSESLHTSLFAFCLVQLHVAHTGHVSLYECLDRYNTALQRLCFDIDNSDTRLREETLAAILTLSTCELFICPTQGGWNAHARGIAAILELRDLNMKTTPTWRHLFSRLRVVCTLEALTKRQAQFLENDAWRQVTDESGFQDAHDQVLLIIADVPAVLQRAAALPSMDDPKSLLKQSAAVISSLFAALRSLVSWLNSFCSVSSAPLFWTVPSSVTNPADDGVEGKVFPVAFEFESLNIAVAVVMCWSVAVQLYSNIIQIHDFIKTRLGHDIELETLSALFDPFTMDTSSTVEAPVQNSFACLVSSDRHIDDIRSEGTRLARLVCQSFEYYHRAEMGAYGRHAITYPVWSARQYYRLHQGHVKESSWIQNMHQMESHGMRWGITGMIFEDIVEPIGGSSNTIR